MIKALVYFQVISEISKLSRRCQQNVKIFIFCDGDLCRSYSSQINKKENLMLRRKQMSLSIPRPQEMGSNCQLWLSLQAFGHCVFWPGFLPLGSRPAGCGDLVSLPVLLVRVSPVVNSGNPLVSYGTQQFPSPAEPWLS